MAPIPSRVYLDLTNACQLRCRHCCTSSGRPHEDELTLGEILDLLDQIHAMGVRSVVFSGGEPMLHPRLRTILHHSRALGLAVTVLTNGLLMNQRWAALFAELGVRAKLSLDGTTAPTHDWLRGRGTFDATLAALKTLLAARAPDVTVHYTVHRLNFRELPRLPSLLARLGVSNVVIGTIKPSGRAARNQGLLIPPRMVPFVHARVSSVKRASGIRVVAYSDRGWGDFGCPATCNKLGITATGRLTTCAFFGDRLLGGSVRKQSLEELWRSHLARDDVFSVNPTCASCEALPQCNGGCRARALYYAGDINAPDPYACALFERAKFLNAQKRLLLSLRRTMLAPCTATRTSTSTPSSVVGAP